MMQGNRRRQPPVLAAGALGWVVLAATVCSVTAPDGATPAQPCPAGEFVDADWRPPAEPVCRSCYLCTPGQECAVRGGCRNCTEGEADRDTDPLTRCEACPEGKSSEPGQTECSDPSIPEQLLNVLEENFVGAVGGAAATVLAAIGACIWKACCGDEEEGEGGEEGDEENLLHPGDASDGVGHARGICRFSCRGKYTALDGSDSESAAGFSSSLDRPFVRKEIDWARKYGKPIITVYEQESWRPGHFDYNKARQKYKDTDFESLLEEDGIPYQRDAFLTKAMVERILAAAKDGGPAEAPEHAPLNDPGSWEFFLSQHQKLGGDQAKTLHLLLEKAGRTTWYDQMMRDKTEAAMEEGVKHSKYFILFLTGGPESDSAESEAPERAAETAEAAEHLEREGACFHIAMQAPLVLIGGETARARLQGRLQALEDHIRENVTERRPICLSDASAATCEVQTHLRDGRVHCLVWCAQGYGWEARDRGGVTALDKAAEIIAALPAERARPRVAFLCLRFGASWAAERLLAAGVENVIWVTADTQREGSEGLFAAVVAPAVDMLQRGNEPAEVRDFLIEALNRMRKRSPAVCPEQSAETCGCQSRGRLVAWPEPAVAEEEGWLRNLAPAAIQTVNMDGCKDLQLLACDLCQVDEMQRRLEYAPAAGIECRVTITTEGIRNARRRRAVALETCLRFTGARVYDRIWRATSPEELREAKATAEDGTALLWLDLGAEVTPDHIESIVEILREDPPEKFHHLLLTVDDEFDDDEARQRALDDLESELYFEEPLELGPEPGVADVYADELHEEFQLSATFDGQLGQQNLLDVFGASRLAEVIEAQLRAVEVSESCRTPTETPVVAIYRGDRPNAILFRVCVSHVGFLHALRDNFLQGLFGQSILDSLRDAPREDGMDSAGALAAVDVDASHFAERYEEAILQLNKLTPHQREKLDECLVTEGSFHIQAPAGAGKTFVALHFMLRKLESEPDSRVLFAAKNLPLAIFVVKWLAQRVKGHRNRAKLLERLHLLFSPVTAGTRVATVRAGRIELEAVDKLAEYEIIVVDEAHHIWRDEEARSSVESYNAKRRVLLSDASQGLHDGFEFPADLTVVELTEVVRCSKRVVSAARKFQTLDVEYRCHHESEGPPLKSHLFDIKPGSDHHAEYAAQTLHALQCVTETFDSLNLDGRLAIIVPDADFRRGLSPQLERELTAAYDARFELANAADAGRILATGDGRDSKQTIVLDSIEQMDGMEWLIVLCVGLDSPAGDARESAAFADSRSLLYRGVTRAHMMVSAVNEFHSDGWLAFLTGVRLSKERKFDPAEAERMSKEAEQQMAEQQQIRRENEKRIEDFLLQERLKAELGDDEYASVRRRLIAKAGGRLPDLTAAVKGARLWWRREQEMPRIPDEITKLEVSDKVATDALRVLARSELLRGAVDDAAAAVKAASKSWDQIESTVAETISRESLDALDSKSLRAGVAAEVARGTRVDAAVRTKLGTALLSEHPDEMPILSGPAASRALHDILGDCLRRSGSVKESVDATLAHWNAVEAARRELAEEKKIEELDEWVQTAELVSFCRNRMGGEVAEGVEAGVAAWEERKKRAEESEKTEQSTWDASGNLTRGIRSAEAQAGKMPTPQQQAMLDEHAHWTAEEQKQSDWRTDEGLLPNRGVCFWNQSEVNVELIFDGHVFGKVKRGSKNPVMSVEDDFFDLRVEGEVEEFGEWRVTSHKLQQVFIEATLEVRAIICAGGHPRYEEYRMNPLGKIVAQLTSDGTGVTVEAICEHGNLVEYLTPRMQQQREREEQHERARNHESEADAAARERDQAEAGAELSRQRTSGASGVKADEWRIWEGIGGSYHNGALIPGNEIHQEKCTLIKAKAIALGGPSCTADCNHKKCGRTSGGLFLKGVAGFCFRGDPSQGGAKALGKVDCHFKGAGTSGNDDTQWHTYICPNWRIRGATSRAIPNQPSLQGGGRGGGYHDAGRRAGGAGRPADPRLCAFCQQKPRHGAHPWCGRHCAGEATRQGWSPDGRPPGGRHAGGGAPAHAPAPAPPPAYAPAPPAGTQLMQVTCPPNTWPGAMVTINAPRGQLQVQVPAGVSPGRVFSVSVPAAPAAAAPYGNAHNR
eukprot:COSAG04_NODE_266_length_18562_cov_11.848995_10_plen_2111_part_00